LIPTSDLYWEQLLDFWSIFEIPSAEDHTINYIHIIILKDSIENAEIKYSKIQLIKFLYNEFLYFSFLILLMTILNKETSFLTISI
jgi:hypothetical protein